MVIVLVLAIAAALLLAPRAGDPTPPRPVEAAPGPLLDLSLIHI